MRILLLFTISFSIFALTLEKEVERYCHDGEMVLPTLIDLENYAEKDDVELQLETIKWSLQTFYRCDEKLFNSESSFSKKIDKIRRKGWNGQIKTIKEFIEKHYERENITPFWNQIQILAEKLELSPYLFISQDKLNQYSEKRLVIAQNNKLTCSPIREREPLQPARDQDSIGWCYAYALSDLLSYRFNQQFSAIHLAYLYNKSQNQFLLVEGAYIKDAYASVKSGLCLEIDLPSSDYNFSLFPNLKAGLEEIYSLVVMGKEKPQVIKSLCGECEEEILKIFPHFSIESLMEMINKSEDPFDDIFKFSCKNLFRPKSWPKLKTEDSYNSSTTENDLLNTINQQLENDNVVAIAYNPTFFFSSLPYDNYLKIIEGHASTVIARRFNNSSGNCEYLIRNSWGPDCEQYHSRFKCEDGHIWVSHDELKNDIQRVHYFE